MRILTGAGNLVLGAVLAMMSGCGLDVMVMSDPPTPQQGQVTNFTLMVKNRTQCTVSNSFALVATFIPPNAFPPGANFCDLITGIGVGGDAELETMLGKVFTQEQVAAAMERAQDRFLRGTASGSAQTTVGCVLNDDNMDGAQGFSDQTVDFDCDIGTIDPLGKSTLMFSANAPFSGPVRTIAIAVGDVPNDADCPPAVSGFPFVTGCFDSGATLQPAPVLSFGGVIATALTLLSVGVLSIRRRRRR